MKISEIPFIKDIENLTNLPLIYFNYNAKDEDTSLTFGNEYILLDLFYDKETSGKFCWHYYFTNRVQELYSENWKELANNERKCEELINNLSYMKNWSKSLKRALKPIFEEYEMRESK